MGVTGCLAAIARMPKPWLVSKLALFSRPSPKLSPSD
jgi:hypothetical protein